MLCLSCHSKFFIYCSVLFFIPLPIDALPILHFFLGVCVLSHFTKSNSDTLNHAFTAINCTDFDIHVVTSSLYDRTQFNRQIFIPDNSSTIYCRPYAKPFVELGYIFSSFFSAVRVLLELSRADSFVKKLFGSMLLLNYCHFVH